MRHHFVPEFLQRPWAKCSSDGKLEVFRLDLASLPSNRHRPKFTGFEQNLFALSKPVAGMDQQVVEKVILRRIDQQAAIVRDKFLNREELSDTEKTNWIRFLASLRLRQPNNIAKLKSDADQNLRKVLNANPEEYRAINTSSTLPTLEAWTEHHFPGLVENFGLALFEKVIDDADAFSTIARMKWWHWNLANSPHELLLSDNPCLVVGDFGQPNFLLALPLSPRSAFIATSSDKVTKEMQRQTTKNLCVLLNESSVNQARARVYATDKRPRTFIRNRLAKTRRERIEALSPSHPR